MAGSDERCLRGAGNHLRAAHHVAQAVQQGGLAAPLGRALQRQLGHAVEPVVHVRHGAEERRGVELVPVGDDVPTELLDQLVERLAELDRLLPRLGVAEIRRRRLGASALGSARIDLVPDQLLRHALEDAERPPSLVELGLAGDVVVDPGQPLDVPVTAQFRRHRAGDQVGQRLPAVVRRLPDRVGVLARRGLGDRDLAAGEQQSIGAAGDCAVGFGPWRIAIPDDHDVGLGRRDFAEVAD